MSVSNRAAIITNLHKVLGKHYKPVPTVERSLLELLLYACFLEDSKPEIADECFARMQESFFDWNEVRVTTVRELTELMRGLIDPSRTATQLKQTLHSIFEALYNFDLEPLKKQNLGVSVKQIQQFRGTSPFMVAYVVQHGLGGHQIPVSPAAFEVLHAIGAVSDAEIAASEAPGLERAISKQKGHEFASLLQQVAADFASSPNSSHLKAVLAEIDPDYKNRMTRRAAQKAEAAAAAAAAKVAAEAEQAERARLEKAAAEKSSEKGRKEKAAKESKAAREAKEAKDAKELKEAKEIKEKEAAASDEAAKKKEADKQKAADKKKESDKKPAELEKKSVEKNEVKADEKAKDKDKPKDKGKDKDEKRAKEKSAGAEKHAELKESKEKELKEKEPKEKDGKDKDAKSSKEPKDKKASTIASKSVKKAVPKKPVSSADGAKKTPPKKGDAKKPPKTIIKKAEPGGKKSTSKQLARRKPR